MPYLDLPASAYTIVKDMVLCVCGTMGSLWFSVLVVVRGPIFIVCV